MRCDASNIACGEHGTGRVAVYSRTEIANRRYRHLEHELGAGVDKEIFDAVRPRYQQGPTEYFSFLSAGNIILDVQIRDHLIECLLT